MLRCSPYWLAAITRVSLEGVNAGLEREAANDDEYLVAVVGLFDQDGSFRLLSTVMLAACRMHGVGHLTQRITLLGAV